MSFHHHFPGRATFPVTTSSPIPAQCPIIPLPVGSPALRCWDLSWPCSQSLVWMFHPLPAPCISKLSSPRHILESGIPRGKLLHLLHNGELKSSISVNSVMVGWA